MHLGFLALACLAITVAGCQSTSTTRVAATSFVDGNWTFGDGQFQASFRGGAFNSKFIATNEQVSAGEYSVAGQNVTLRWVSFRDRSERTAICSLSAPRQLTCRQSTGQSFVMRRA